MINSILRIFILVISINTFSFSQDSAKYFYNLGMQMMKIKKNDKALECFSKAIEKNKKYAEAYNKRGLVKQYIEEYAVEIADFDTAIILKPDFAEAYKNRGDVEITDDDTSSITDYDKAIQLNPKYAEAYYARAYAVFRIFKDKKRACKDMEMAEKLGFHKPKYDANEYCE